MFVSILFVSLISEMNTKYETMAKRAKKAIIPVAPKLPFEVIGALADKFGKDILTIRRWIKAKDDRLTSDKAKEVFTEKNIDWN